MEANNFNAVYGFCFRAGHFSGSPLRHRRLEAATNRWPIAFDPEGLPLDQGVSLNCGIRFSLPFRSRSKTSPLTEFAGNIFSSWS